VVPEGLLQLVSGEVTGQRPALGVHQAGAPEISTISRPFSTV
jgi:hypothetical protein